MITKEAPTEDKYLGFVGYFLFNLKPLQYWDNYGIVGLNTLSCRHLNPLQNW